MAYHNLNEKNIPLTSYPSVPLASPPSQPQGAVYYAQPVAQPVGQVPYAQQPGQPPAAYVPAQIYQPHYTPGQSPVAQPVMQAPQMYAVAYQPVYVAPASVAQPAPPVPQNYEALKTALRARDGHFHYKRYLKDAHRFTSKNWCKLFFAILLWSMVGWGVSAAIDKISRHGGFKKSHDWSDHYPAGGDVIEVGCEQQRAADISACGGLGCFKTQCNTDGSYASKQTLGSQCWCVDERGYKFEDTVTSCSTFNFNCAVRRTQTTCEAVSAMQKENCAGKTGCFITDCDKHGQFESEQTDGSMCWCVDSQGNERNGTRSVCNDEFTCPNPFFDIPFSAHVNSVMAHPQLGLIVLWGFLHFLAAILLWGPVAGGMFLAVFNAIRTNSKIKFRDFFRCFCCRYYCKLVGLSFVLQFLKGFFFVLLILPGLWWSLVTMFAIPLHKEHPFLGVCGSIRISMMVIHRHFCHMICFLLLLALVQLAGFLCLIVGLLYTMPLAFVALCFCYDDLIGVVTEAPFAGPVDTPVTVHV